MTATSPTIDDDGWGHVTVAGETFKDAKLWPGGARAWDWNETGTDHGGGIRPADLRELVDHGCTRVVLSTGREQRLAVHADTLALLEASGVDHEVLETGAAVRRYGQLREAGTAVGALLHTTC